MWPLTTIRTRNVQVSRKDHRKRQAQHKTGLCGAGPKNRQMKSAHLSSFSRTMMKRNRKKEKEQNEEQKKACISRTEHTRQVMMEAG